MTKTGPRDTPKLAAIKLEWWPRSDWNRWPPSSESAGGENWACLASLIETCKLNGVNPQAYFADVLTRLVNGWPESSIDELMPWHWVPEQPP
jgi:hypothetical protein